jgi:hypothetical protein
VRAVDHEPKDRTHAAVDLIHHESDHRDARLQVPTRRAIVDPQRHQGRVRLGLGQRLGIRRDEFRLRGIHGELEAFLLVLGGDPPEMDLSHGP